MNCQRPILSLMCAHRGAITNSDNENETIIAAQVAMFKFVVSSLVSDENDWTHGVHLSEDAGPRNDFTQRE